MPKRPPPEPEGALYVKLPANAVEKLHRAAEMLGIKKKDLVANLVSKYVDPDSKQGRGTLEQMSQPRRIFIDNRDEGPTLGAYSFQPHDPPEVLNVQAVAELLQLDRKVVLEMAEAGQLPGRKLGTEWRFSRTAIIAWLAG
jgi:excisionase family DNA binding protein